jgi:hypothetical protein
MGGGSIPVASGSDDLAGEHLPPYFIDDSPARGIGMRDLIEGLAGPVDEH